LPNAKRKQKKKAMNRDGGGAMAALDACWEGVKPAGMFLSGALFGLGWFAAADALCRAAFVLHKSVPATYCLPGVVASLALLLVAAVRRSDVSPGNYDEGAAARSRCALFLGYALSFGAVSGGVVALALAKQRGEDDLWAPAAVVIQCALISAAGMLAFVSRGGGDDDGDPFGYGGF
jgi:hypothetical protein